MFRKFSSVIVESQNRLAHLQQTLKGRYSKLTTPKHPSFQNRSGCFTQSSLLAAVVTESSRFAGMKSVPIETQIGMNTIVVVPLLTERNPIAYHEKRPKSLTLKLKP